MKDTPVKYLVDCIKESDEKAFKILFNKLWEPLYVYACSLLKDETIAKDLVQDVWIDFWERRLKIENDNITSYLYTATKYKVLNEFKNSKLRESYLEVFKQLQYYCVDEEKITVEETNVIIENTLSILPEKCQQVFILSRLKGLKNKEISEELDISERTVETHISKAIKLIKKDSVFLVF